MLINREIELPGRSARAIWPTALAVCLLAAAMLIAGLRAPAERTMGDVQRILYLHVPVAWASLLCFAMMAGTGLMYLLRRNLAWDHWSRSAGELGWLACSLTLISGSLWARAAWGTWWTWDPRLTAAFILWAIYSGYLVVRSSVDDPHRAARLGAVLALVGAADLPLVVMATRWFRGVHPTSPEMDPTMRAVLFTNLGIFLLLIALLLVRRRAQLNTNMQFISRDPMTVSAAMKRAGKEDLPVAKLAKSFGGQPKVSATSATVDKNSFAARLRKRGSEAL